MNLLFNSFINWFQSNRDGNNIRHEREPLLQPPNSIDSISEASTHSPAESISPPINTTAAHATSAVDARAPAANAPFTSDQTLNELLGRGDILHKVSEYLDITDQANLSLTCKQFYADDQLNMGKKIIDILSNERNKNVFKIAFFLLALMHFGLRQHCKLAALVISCKFNSQLNETLNQLCPTEGDEKNLYHKLCYGLENNQENLLPTLEQLNQDDHLLLIAEILAIKYAYLFLKSDDISLDNQSTFANICLLNNKAHHYKFLSHGITRFFINALLVSAFSLHINYIGNIFSFLLHMLTAIKVPLLLATIISYITIALPFIAMIAGLLTYFNLFCSSPTSPSAQKIISHTTLHLVHYLIK